MIITKLAVLAVIEENKLKTKEIKPTVKKTMKMITKITKWKLFQIHLVFMMMICKNGIRSLVSILKKEKFKRKVKPKLKIFTA